MFAPGHLGELTGIVGFDLVDAALEQAGAVQSRVRVLPSRVVVYLLLAGALFTGIGYRQVWARLCAGLSGVVVAAPGSSALAQALRRVGVKPLRVLFDLVRGPAAGAARWRGLLVCAIDGTTMFVPDSAANVAGYGRHGGGHAVAGYPMLRLLAVVACGTRTVVDAVFGTDKIAEITYAPRLLGCLMPGMLLLADRNFAVTALIEQISGTGADLLIRAKLNRKVPTIARLDDGSWLTRIGTVTVRVIDAEIVVRCADGPRRTGRYRLLTSLADPHRWPAAELVALYHQRWEIEACGS
ncbi:IS4 family transposase [Nocardia amamiensis]|uniref:IS4 family transposase n=1 Tax=Nocardia amamiensis TaxID=404578 RepID=UPI000832ABA2|nr:IS4 family transposase [Nocardia amamiensis]